MVIGLGLRSRIENTQLLQMQVKEKTTITSMAAMDDFWIWQNVSLQCDSGQDDQQRFTKFTDTERFIFKTLNDT